MESILKLLLGLGEAGFDCNFQGFGVLASSLEVRRA